VAAWLPGSQTLSNMSRTFDDAMTFGGADYATAKVGAALHSLLGLPNVPSADDLRAQTASASAALPAAVRIPTEIAGYAMGPGPAGAEALGLRGVGLVRGALGGAAEGAAASGLGAAGHGGSLSDVEGAAETGGATGAVAGGLGGAFSRGPKPQGPLGADLLATAKQNFGDADNILYNNADIRQGMMNARNEIGQQPNRVTRLGQGALDQIGDLEGQALGRGAMSAADLNDYIKALHNTQTGDDVAVAGQIAQKHLNLILDQGQPISGQAAGAGGATISAANNAFGRAADLDRLGDDPTQLTKAAVSKTAGFYPTVPGGQPGPEAQSLSALQGALQPPFNWWHVRHMAGPVLGASLGAAEGFFNPAEKQNPWLTAATQGLEGAALFSGLPAGAAAIGRARAANALAGARYAIGTGQAAPAATLGPGGNALRNLILGQGAANQWPY
jgi:hypothetical protein